MHEPVVYILIGFFVGAIVGGAVVSKRQEKEYVERLEDLSDENAGLKKELWKKRENVKADKAEPNIVKEKKVDFVKLSKEYKSPEFDQHFADRAHPEDDLDNDDNFDDIELDENERVYLISEKEYLDEVTKRGSDTLRYYQEDGVLTDSDGEPIRDQVGVIGVECMEEIEGTSRDELYVSNDNYDMVYLIHVDHSKSYYADIMGI